jgi:hexokinase
MCMCRTGGAEMERVKNKVINFLRSCEMDFEDIDIPACVEIFTEEMRKGLQGKPSSLGMLPTYIEVEKEIPLEKPVIALDAGGTNFRVATLYFDNKKRPVIENYEKQSMPGIHSPVTKTQFFETIAQYIGHVVDKSDCIGFCFSYPTEMLPNRDGKTIQFSKEIKAEQVIGELLGENLLSTLRRMGKNAGHRVAILNDTVATLLAGRSAFQKRTFDSFIGFILGTGTNSAYVEKNSAIEKLTGLDPEKAQVVNTEFGGFGKASRGSIDIEYDRSMQNPGEYTFEKMISGAYFGPLCLWTLRGAAEHGLFSMETRERLGKLRTLDTKEVSDYMLDPESGSTPISKAMERGSAQDSQTTYRIIDRLIERAAKLSAVALSSVVIQSGKGKDPLHPVCITADGSTFYGLKSLRARVQFYMKDFLMNRKGHYYEFVKVENAPLIGAAIAGLTN